MLPATMSDTPIRFDDGAGYERMMGVWSRLAGDTFLGWVQPQAGLRWLDVGCGNGAFTDLLLARCAPASVTGIDPSEGQLAYARTRHPGVEYLQGDAMQLPFADASFDAAVMALVLFFVPQPARGVAEMARVVRPGGTVCAYAWDILGGGFPFAPLGREMRNLGMQPPLPPSVEAADIERMAALWREAGLVDVKTRTIEVARRFPDFEDLWESVLLGPSVRQTLDGQPAAVQTTLRERVRAQCKPDAQGGITWTARANAVTGRRA